MSGYQLYIKDQIPKLNAQGIKGKDALSSATKSWKSLDQKTTDAYNQEAKLLTKV
jgi:hypothetical protein